jgi:hypothetical protein
MSARRIRFRPPGAKPWTRIGMLGPFRGRLGLAWVIAPLLVGVAIVVAGWYFLMRNSPASTEIGPPPGGSFISVGSVESFHEGAAQPIEVPGVFVGKLDGRIYAVRAESGCSIEFCAGTYTDCRGARYGIDGTGVTDAGALDVLPVVVHGGTIFVDPDHPIEGTPGPILPGPPENPC